MRKWIRWVKRAHAHEDLSPRAGLTPEEIDLWAQARGTVIRERALHLRLRERQWRRFLRPTSEPTQLTPRRRALVCQYVREIEATVRWAAMSGQGTTERA